MKTSDNERLKKIVNLWSALLSQMEQHRITKDSLLKDEFLQ